jgi:hypothetical protein
MKNSHPTQSLSSRANAGVPAGTPPSAITAGRTISGSTRMA